MQGVWGHQPRVGEGLGVWSRWGQSIGRGRDPSLHRSSTAPHQGASPVQVLLPERAPGAAGVLDTCHPGQKGAEGASAGIVPVPPRQRVHLCCTRAKLLENASRCSWQEGSSVGWRPRGCSWHPSESLGRDQSALLGSHPVPAARAVSPQPAGVGSLACAVCLPHLTSPPGAPRGTLSIHPVMTRTSSAG